MLFCGSELARDGGLTADLVFADVPNPCGSGLAREGGLPADRNLADVLDTCGSELARDSDLAVDEVHHSRTNPANRPAGMPSLSEAPNVRGKSPWLLGAGRRSAFPSDPP
ncbi:hypothetical protein D3C86_1683950 [compost metagenome]